MSLNTIIEEIIEQDRRILEASDIPKELRPEVIRAWLDDADGIEMDEALQGGSNSKDECRTLALFACGMTSETAAKYLLKRFWEGMSWRVDKAIEAIREQPEMRQSARDDYDDSVASDRRAIAREWNREVMA